MADIEQKYKRLQDIVAGYDSMAVAYSAGVDSTLLLEVCHRVLGDRVTAVTIKSSAFPQGELQAAREYCRSKGIRHIICDFDPLDVPGFSKNNPDRCYICKRAMFELMTNAAADAGIATIAEGSNTDDRGDYRPGMRAINELGVLSPLLQSDMSKADIRILSQQLGLPTDKKPSMACLATRFEYGQEITADGLRMVELAERMLTDIGAEQVRVRVHRDIARIEVAAHQFTLLTDNAERINSEMKSLGFAYVTMDMGGYRTGSMNINIEQGAKNC